jgi:transcriptional regulator with XRE-family HTH domain
VPRPNHSELWQRLRVARELATKTHHDVGAAVGVDEATVALWESADPATRLQPTAQQVMRIAKLCRLPLYLLVDDAVSMQDIQSYTAP